MARFLLRGVTFKVIPFNFFCLLRPTSLFPLVQAFTLVVPKDTVALNASVLFVSLSLRMLYSFKPQCALA